jgi:hypothetical protein
MNSSASMTVSPVGSEQENGGVGLEDKRFVGSVAMKSATSENLFGYYF